MSHNELSQTDVHLIDPDGSIAKRAEELLAAGETSWCAAFGAAVRERKGRSMPVLLPGENQEQE